MNKNLQDEIAKVAYELHQKRGRSHGQDRQDWLEAERIVLARQGKGTEKKAKKPAKAATKKAK